MSKKRVWKPIDLGGYRLYEVILRWQLKGNRRANRKHYHVAANSPTHAASLITDIYRDTFDGREDIADWDVKGYPLNILQPVDWWDSGVPDGFCEQCKKFSLRIVGNELVCSNDRSHGFQLQPITQRSPDKPTAGGEG